MKHFDYIIIGAGIVGMSVAYQLRQRDRSAKISILEKEDKIGKHASGRNSGVLHSGIYYKEDSFKAKVCALGAKRLIEFAQTHDIPIFHGGKVIVPNSEHEHHTLDTLMHNAQKNGVAAQYVDEQQLLELEPYATRAAKAIYCPTTAVIDNKAVLEKLKQLLLADGVEFLFNTAVMNIDVRNKILKTSQGEMGYQYFFNCAGAYADTLAKMEGLSQDYTLLPFKGIYYKLSATAAEKIRSNIYPVPNISTPFLGVHFTRALSGDVFVGPTAIPVFGRENYARLQGINPKETFDLLVQMSKLFWSNANDFRTVAKSELLKYRKREFFKAARKLVPSLAIDDLITSSKAGIRPQLMNKKTKALEMDYIFEKTPSSIHVLNAISPAFTSSFAFADLVLQQAGF